MKMGVKMIAGELIWYGGLAFRFFMVIGVCKVGFLGTDL